MTDLAAWEERTRETRPGGRGRDMARKGDMVRPVDKRPLRWFRV